MLKPIIMENNPDLKQLQFLTDAAGRTIDRARMNYLPDFSLGVDYMSTGEKWNASGDPVPESGKDPFVIMGSVSIPLWFNKQSAGVKTAEQQKKASESKHTRKQNALTALLEKTIFELDDAVRKVWLYKDVLIPKSLESLRASEKAYIGDEIDFLNLVDAQRRALQFELSYERALVNYYKTMARLEALAGRSV